MKRNQVGMISKKTLVIKMSEKEKELAQLKKEQEATLVRKQILVGIKTNNMFGNAISKKDQVTKLDRKLKISSTKNANSKKESVTEKWSKRPQVTKLDRKLKSTALVELGINKKKQFAKLKLKKSHPEKAKSKKNLVNELDPKRKATPKIIARSKMYHFAELDCKLKSAGVATLAPSKKRFDTKLEQKIKTIAATLGSGSKDLLPKIENKLKTTAFKVGRSKKDLLTKLDRKLKATQENVANRLNKMNHKVQNRLNSISIG